MTRIDLRQPVPSGIKIGPLTYGKWDSILNDVFEAARTKYPVIRSYELKNLDEFLTFSREKAIKMGMATDPTQIDPQKYKVNIEERWSPSAILWTLLNRKAAAELRYQTTKQFTSLGRSSSVFLELKTLIARINMGEPLSTDDIIKFNKSACTQGLPFLITQS
jgi:hypothetical protein